VDESGRSPEIQDDVARTREFDERFRALAAFSSDPITEVDESLRITYVSPGFTEAFGYSAEEVLGRLGLEYIHPEDTGALRDARARAVPDRTISNLRFRYRHKNGSWRWVELTACPYRTRSGDVRAVLINRDVTEHVEAQRKLQDQLTAERRIEQLSRHFLTAAADDFDAAIEHGLRSAAELAGADRVQFFALERGSVNKVYQWHCDEVEDRDWEYSDEAVAQWRWSGTKLMRGESIVVRRVSEMPEEAAPERESMIENGVRSYLAIPVVHRGTTIGFLDFLCIHGERAWSDQDVSRLGLLTDVFASALRRHRSEISRRESEQRLQALASRTSDSICEVAEDGSILFASASFGDLLGYEPADLNSIRAADLIHPDDRIDLERQLASQRRRQSDAITLQARARHRDGSWHWLEATARGFENSSGELRFAVVIRDVTQRRRAQEELEMQLALERRLTRLSNEFLDRGADEIDAGIQHALAVVGEMAGADRCWLVTWARESDATLQTYEWQAEGISPRPLRTGLADRRHQAWIFETLMRGDVVTIRRPEDLPESSAKVRDQMLETGVRSFLAIPIRAQETLVGVLGFHSVRQVREWSDRVINLFRLVAGIFTSALRRKRSEADLRESEERFRALAEHAQDPICEVDTDGRILFASPSFTDLLGYAREEIASLNLFSIVHEDDFESIRAELTQTRADAGAPSTLLYRARHREGHWIVLEGTAEFFKSASGDDRIVAVIRDVTERQRAQQALERQLDLETRIAVLSRRFLGVGPEEINRTVRESLADLAALAEADRSWLYWIDPRDESGAEVFEWHHPNVPSHAREISMAGFERFPVTVKKLMRGFVVHYPDMQNLPPGTEEEQREFRARGVRSYLCIPLQSGQRSVAFLGFETTRIEKKWNNEVITLLRLVGEIFVTARQRKHIEDDLRESQQQLMQAQKMEAVGTLAGGIAHDFNNQLTVMLGNARFVMRQVADEPELKDALTDLNRAAEHCAQLTRSLLAFSRRSTASPRALDVREVVRQVEELLRPLIPNSIEFFVTIPEDAGCVEADPTQLQQVLVNLAINARDAMPDGGQLELIVAARAVDTETAARVGLETPGDYVEISVMDTGHGIDEGTQKRIFEPFFTTKPLGQGTGLGLATAYGIVTECRGAILVDSIVGAGTKFRVLLPRSEPSDADEILESGPPVAVDAACILVVEDERAVGRFIRSTLERSDFTVVQTTNGDEALRLARTHRDHIDAVVTDVNMPEMDGFALARSLDAILPGVPVLFLSGSERPTGDGEDARTVVHWLQKPFGEEELVDTLRSILAAGGDRA